MRNARSKNLGIAKRFVNGELTVEATQAEFGVTRGGVYYWAHEWKQSIGDTCSKKPRNAALNKEIVTTDELEKLARPMQGAGEVKCQRLLKCFASIEN